MSLLKHFSFTLDTGKDFKRKAIKTKLNLKRNVLFIVKVCGFCFRGREFNFYENELLCEIRGLSVLVKL